MEGFEVERIVGEGSYGKAILAKCKKDNKKVIIKVKTIIIIIIIIMLMLYMILANQHKETIVKRSIIC